MTDAERLREARKGLIRDAINAAGGAENVRRMLLLADQDSVHNWVKRASVPPEYAPLIESWTGGRFRCEALCPGIPWAVLRLQAAETLTTENNCAAVRPQT